MENKIWDNNVHWTVCHLRNFIYCGGMDLVDAIDWIDRVARKHWPTAIRYRLGPTTTTKCSPYIESEKAVNEGEEESIFYVLFLHFKAEYVHETE